MFQDIFNNCSEIRSYLISAGDKGTGIIEHCFDFLKILLTSTKLTEVSENKDVTLPHPNHSPLMQSQGCWWGGLWTPD